MHDLFILDRLVSGDSPKLQTFLKEKGQIYLKDTAYHGDNWTAAGPIGVRPNACHKGTVSQTAGNSGDASRSESHGKGIPNRSRSDPNGPSKGYS